MPIIHPKLLKKLLVRDGHPLAVLRPLDVEAALAKAKRAQEKNDWNEVQDPDEAFIFIGWLTKKGRIVDYDGVVLGTPQAGDHFSVLTDNSEAD